MSAPTKEQIEAARAWVRDEETDEQREILREFDQGDSLPRNAACILLATLETAEAEPKAAMQAGGYEHFTAQVRNANQQAHNAIYVAQQLEKKLEAAEADSARLDWLNEHPESVPYMEEGFWLILRDGGFSAMTHRTLRGVVDAARKEAQP